MSLEGAIVLLFSLLFLMLGFLSNQRLVRKISVLYTVAFLLLFTSEQFGKHHPNYFYVGLNVLAYVTLFTTFMFSYRIVSHLRFIRRREYIDPMTKVYNRLYLEEVIKPNFWVYKNMGLSIGVIFVDVDNLKFINDNYGHAKGDEYIIDVAQALINSIRTKEDAVVRYGGDEFIVFVLLDSCVHIAPILDRIRENIEGISQSFNFPADASVGFACHPEDGDKIEDLINIADQRMYQEKMERKQHGQFNSFVL